MAIEARAYDDGVAFRYIVPEQAGVKELRITNEAHEFRFQQRRDHVEPDPARFSRPATKTTITN